MAPGSNRSVSRIRTFNADVSSARGDTKKPGGPKLKKEEKTAQQKADAILKTPKEDVLPSKAKKLKEKKRKSERTSHEFLSANTDIPPAEPIDPPKKEVVEAIPSAAALDTPTEPPTPPKRRRKKKKVSRSLTEELAQYSTLPKEIKVAPSYQQNVKVDEDKLQDEVRQIQSQHTTTTTFEDVAPVSLQDDDDGGAVIIQNKKRKRFRLFPAIGNSLQSWAGEKKEVLTHKEEPKHLVNKAESRLETIAQAAREGYHAPQSDHGIIVKRLTKKKRSQKSTGHTIKKKEEIAAPSWTYTTGDDVPKETKAPIPEQAPPLEPVPVDVPSVEDVLEEITTPTPTEPTPAPPAETETIDNQLKDRVITSTKPEWKRKKHTASDFLAQTSEATTTTETPKPEPTPQAPTPLPKPEPEPAPAVSPEPVTQPVVTPEPDPEPVQQTTPEPIPTPIAEPTPEPAVQPVVTQEVAMPEPEPAPAVSPEPVTQPVATPEPAPEPQISTEPAPAVSQKKRVYAPAPENTPSRVPIYIYGLVIVGASLLGIGTSVYWFMSSTPQQEAIVITIPTLIAASNQVPVPLHTSRNETYDAILNASLQTRETIQIYPTVTNPDGMAVPADAQTIMQGLGVRIPGSFMRSIEEVTFGSVGGTDPFIVMRVQSFDTAFAGMLAWEPVLSSDLSPLFGLPVSESYDPYARTDTQIRSAFFRDTIAANSSARMLVDANNTERIIYSFVNQNTILITTNSETFSTIAPLISVQ